MLGGALSILSHHHSERTRRVHADVRPGVTQQRENLADEPYRHQLPGRVRAGSLRRG